MDPISPIKIRRIGVLSIQKFSMHFQVNFNHIREGLQLSEDIVSNILVPIAMLLLQGTSDNCLKLLQSFR